MKGNKALEKDFINREVPIAIVVRAIIKAILFFKRSEKKNSGLHLKQSVLGQILRCHS